MVLEQAEGNHLPDSFIWVVKYKETIVDLRHLSLSLWIPWKQSLKWLKIFVVPSRTRLVMMYQCQPTLGSLHC